MKRSGTVTPPRTGRSAKQRRATPQAAPAAARPNRPDGRRVAAPDGGPDLYVNQIAHYQITAVLGSGGMGSVFKARDGKKDRTVAVKLLASRLLSEPEFVARFEREVQVNLALRHPNIVRGLDAGWVEGRPYLVMELVRGRSLDRILDHRQRLPEEEALRIVRAVLHALEYAHARGVLHRDVKPDNVLVGLDGSVKLSDFGLARLIASDRRLTRNGIALGTPDYIAPEQIECRPDADGRADLYSLGAMLYRMLSGVALYPAENDQKMMLRHLYDPLPDPRTAVPGLSAHTVAVLHRLLAKKPADRYPDAAAAGADFDDLLEGRRPRLAGGPATPAQRFLQQHGATLLGGGLLALGAILLFAVAKVLTRG